MKMRQAIVFELSRRTVINRAVDSTIESTMVMLIMYLCRMALILRECLERHLVTL